MTDQIMVANSLRARTITWSKLSDQVVTFVKDLEQTLAASERSVQESLQKANAADFARIKVEEELSTERLIRLADAERKLSASGSATDRDAEWQRTIEEVKAELVRAQEREIVFKGTIAALKEEGKAAEGQEVKLKTTIAELVLDGSRPGGSEGDRMAFKREESLHQQISNLQRELHAAQDREDYLQRTVTRLRDVAPAPSPTASLSGPLVEVAAGVTPNGRVSIDEATNGRDEALKKKVTALEKENAKLKKELKEAEDKQNKLKSDYDKLKVGIERFLQGDASLFEDNDDDS